MGSYLFERLSLGAPIFSPFLRARHTVFEQSISLNSCPRLHDHRIDGVLVVPAAFFVSMALQAASELGLANNADGNTENSDTSSCRIVNLSVPQPLVLTDEGNDASAAAIDPQA